MGYSINDPDLIQVQTEISFDLQQHQRLAYAILFDADAFIVSDRRVRNVCVLNILTGEQADHTERLGELLDELILQVEEIRR